MKPVHQTIFSPPHGNCLQAAVASVLELELEQVPNFMKTTGPEWYDSLVSFLLRYDLYPLYLPVDEAIDDTRPIGYCLIQGKSPRGDFQHILVGYDGQPMHDPNPDGGCELDSMDYYVVFVSTMKADL